MGKTDRFAPIVERDNSEKLHWAGNEYILVFNGDLVDRGTKHDETVELAFRLMDEAPAGHVRYHLGNHEMAVLLPSVLSWANTYSCNLGPDERRTFIEYVASGHVTAAFEGYNHVYSHAGDDTELDVSDLNRQTRIAAEKLLTAMEHDEYESGQRAIPEEYPDVFGLGEPFGRGPDAGILWMDFKHMPADAPSQIVGHSMQSAPTRKGNTVCENVIRQNHDVDGGEGVLVETPKDLTAITRDANGGVNLDSLA